MTPETLHRLLKTLHETERAWQSASTAGGAHVHTLCNALQTLSDATLYTSQPAPAPGELRRVHDAGAASMRWLRTCVTRLKAALGGAERAAEQICAAHQRWGALVAPLVQGFRDDFAEKNAVLDRLVRCVQGGRVERERLQRDVAIWLEGVACVRGGAEAVLAAYVAEVEAGVEGAGSEEFGRTAGVGGMAVKKRDESAAVAFLRMAGQGTS